MQLLSVHDGRFSGVASFWTPKCRGMTSSLNEYNYEYQNSGHIAELGDYVETYTDQRRVIGAVEIPKAPIILSTTLSIFSLLRYFHLFILSRLILKIVGQLTKFLILLGVRLRESSQTYQSTHMTSPSPVPCANNQCSTLQLNISVALGILLAAYWVFGSSSVGGNWTKFQFNFPRTPDLPNPEESSTNQNYGWPETRDYFDEFWLPESLFPDESTFSFPIYPASFEASSLGIGSPISWGIESTDASMAEGNGDGDGESPHSGADKADDEGPYICHFSECNGAQFSRKCDLNRHNKRQHTRPHKCTRCPKAFSSKSDLERHFSAVHSPPSLFCPVEGCNRSENYFLKKCFHRRDHLNNHMRNKHPNYRNDEPATSSSSATPMPERAPDSAEDVSQDHIQLIPAQSACQEANEDRFQLMLQPQVTPLLGSRKRPAPSDEDIVFTLAKKVKVLEAELADVKAMNKRLQEINDIRTRMMERTERGE